jgi:hypothetical protein
VSEIIDVICFKWKPRVGYRSSFDARAVNTLRNMVSRNLHLPHRFTCITDDARGIDPEVRIIPVWDTYAKVQNPSSPVNPSCYRRLKIFSQEARELIGERIVCMDLDVVITADITPLIDRYDDFIIWGGQNISPQYRKPYSWYNGSLMLLRAGTRQQVWKQFDPHRSPREANSAGCRGSDQGWISYILGKHEKTWGTEDGVYSYRNHIQPSGDILPDNARFISFHGKYDPWHPHCESLPWIREHYR